MKKYLFTLFVATLCLFVLKAENTLFVDFFSQAESEYVLSVIGRIEVKDEVFRLISVDGEELASCDLYEVRKLTFGERPETSVEYLNQTNQILFFPNPTQDILFINGLKPNEVTRIYTLDGHLVSVNLADDGGELQLSVTQFPRGTYLLQVGVQVVKFIKQ